ncbi:phage portal protein [Paraburkholderia caledonica]|uniref:phage portal protein n=1 Tax=Paraburkholderia caledonica TaxID=134536 RepID=UPI0038B84DA8
MSAHAYIQYAALPQLLIDSSTQHIDSVTKAKVVAFDGCPFCGQIDVLSDGRIQIEFPWPRARELRHALDDWMNYHGINYTVVM